MFSRKKNKSNLRKFTDPDFQANNSSLYNERIKKDKAFLLNIKLVNLNAVKWCRPDEILSRKISKKNATDQPLCLYRDPLPTDVVQGSLGSCWYLSALASVVNRPKQFEKIFLTEIYSEQGVYTFRMCIRGKWKNVTVDDLLPVNLGILN